MDRGVWWATVQGVVKNWTGPNTHTHTHTHTYSILENVPCALEQNVYSAIFDVMS